MTAKALEIPPKPYTGEKARLSRAYDYLILVLALFLFIGAFHLHVALTVGDWDFLVGLEGPAMVAPCHPVDDDHLPGGRPGGALVKLPLADGRDALHFVSSDRHMDRAVLRLSPVELFPDQRGAAATMLPSALVLDVILMLSNSLTITSIFGGIAFACYSTRATGRFSACFTCSSNMAPPSSLSPTCSASNIDPAGSPEYLRIIEKEQTLRTYGQYATPLSAFCSAVLCTLISPLWWYLGKIFATTKFVKSI